MELRRGSFKAPLSVNGKSPVRYYGYMENVCLFLCLLFSFPNDERAMQLDQERAFSGMYGTA